MSPDGMTSIAPRSQRFGCLLSQHKVDLSVRSIETLQVNLTRTCNQACRHCHVDASPSRTESLSAAGVQACLKILADHPLIRILDLTGGAPELHPQFEQMVIQARRLGKKVMVRHNLTVQFDGHPQSGEGKSHLPDFFAAHDVEVVSSLPYYKEYFTDAQRGKGVFGKSIDAIRRLNERGYGVEGSGLVLNLVYNPVGPYLPAAQASLEADYKRELHARFGLCFNGLFTITNMPIHRFALHLRKSGQFDDYMEKLAGAFNPAAAVNVMCRDMISVSHDGLIYDCDFNQMLEMPAKRPGGGQMNIFEFDYDQLTKRSIQLDDHCLGCTAGGGSSCGGATA